MNHYEQLKSVLNDIFELNKADLDFGIYRIINQKRKQVNAFIEQQLPKDIKEALSATQPAGQVELEQELKQLKKSLEDLDMVAEDNPKYLAKQEQLKAAGNTDALEHDVFSHLANFFRRYYKDGDFISMRRYKKDVYAIPYEGEEVKLHWANHDQYYIKSSENFKNYSFKLPDGTKITFQLKEANTEQNNNKTQGDAERRFALYTEQPVESAEGELLINFVYEPFPKATKQEDLKLVAYKTILEQLPEGFAVLTSEFRNDKGEGKTRKEKINGKDVDVPVDLLYHHLNSYISKNSFDYFIHKDLGGFLHRELDFYIKNEVLYIDDINDREPAFFVAQLGKIKAMKAVATKIIDFLAQIENFQKKLWLKKKFVLRTDYCITLDRIDSKYYPEIAANKAQLQAWKSLYGVDIQNPEQLVFEPFLVLDTQFFPETFKDRLLAEFDDLDGQTDGLLINSENFQALGLLQEKYREGVKCVYIDPPYNTGSDGFAYKDSWRHSSWLSLIFDRFVISLNLLKEDGIKFISIDDWEIQNLKSLINQITDASNHLATFARRTKSGGGSASDFFAIEHDYMICYSKDKSKLGKLFIDFSEDYLKRYSEEDDDGKFFWDTMERSSTKTKPYKIKAPDGEMLSGKWFRSEETFLNDLERGEVRFLKKDDGRWSVQFKQRLPQGKKMRSLLWEKEFKSSQLDLVQFGLMVENLYPKPIYLLEKVVEVGLKEGETALDYFAGSGTTGHAVIKLNREDKGRRKYILVEMGHYFNTVTKPRIQKVIYTDHWKNGQPQDKGGISQMVKYQVLESYEDTLNNLQLQTPSEQGLLAFSPRAQEEYLLQYMLDIESRAHLVNLAMFRKPFDCQLKVTEHNELRPVKVDLVETFNYLIGLHVQQVQRIKDMKVVEGVTRAGLKTLVIWRDLDTTTQEDVAKLVRRFYDSTRTKEFQQIFINGDHHLENIRVDGEQFKIKLVEETFFKKMFDETEL